MAKNSRTGTLVVSSRVVTRYDGDVLQVSDGGVSISVREFGRQTRQDMYFPHTQIIAHTDEGPGFVVVIAEQVLATYHGTIETSDANISVTTEGGRTVYAETDNGSASTYIIFDREDGTIASTHGKEGARQSGRLDRATDKEGGSKPKKTTKKEASGKRR